MNKLIINKVLAISSLVLLSCCSNFVFLEAIIKLTPGAGNIISLAQNLAISVEGFIITTKCGRKMSKIPLKNYIFLVIKSFAVSFTTSLANVYKMPMPLIMIIRSGSLIANLILGILILKRHYSLSKYVSVVIITFGIVVCTLASVQNKSRVDSKEPNNYEWLAGISLMLFSLFVSAYRGISQEKLFEKFGKHSSEALFYTHFLQLPAFLFLSSDITKHIVIFNNSKPFQIPLLLFTPTIPELWLLLFFNCLFQYVCIRSVYVLTTECTSLTVTLVVTLRKFLSIIISIIYFQNPFTTSHWLGTVCVFLGTVLFVEIPQRVFKLKLK